MNYDFDPLIFGSYLKPFTPNDQVSVIKLTDKKSCRKLSPTAIAKKNVHKQLSIEMKTKVKHCVVGLMVNRCKVHRKHCFTLAQCQSVSTFGSEVGNSLSVLEPHSMDSLGHQHHAKSISIFKSANNLALYQRPNSPGT